MRLLVSTTLLCALALSARADETLRVKASPVTAPCVESAARAFRQTSGRPVSVESAPVEAPDAGRGFDIVVGADGELTRVIEGGSSHPDRDIDVARIPWVLVGTASPAEGRVLVVDGTVGLEARAYLRRIGKVAAAATVPRGGPVQSGTQAALVPVSLAGANDGTPIDVPPVVVRAVGMRASQKQAVVVEFLAFLESGPGSAAFCACGRGVAR